MKEYDKKEASYLKYLDVNNFYVWTMPRKLPVHGFKGFKIHPSLINIS